MYILVHHLQAISAELHLYYHRIIALMIKNITIIMRNFKIFTENIKYTFGTTELGKTGPFRLRRPDCRGYALNRVVPVSGGSADREAMMNTEYISLIKNKVSLEYSWKNLEQTSIKNFRVTRTLESGVPKLLSKSIFLHFFFSFGYYV